MTPEELWDRVWELAWDLWVWISACPCSVLETLTQACEMAERQIYANASWDPPNKS